MCLPVLAAMANEGITSEDNSHPTSYLPDVHCIQTSNLARARVETGAKYTQKKKMTQQQTSQTYLYQ